MSDGILELIYESSKAPSYDDLVIENSDNELNLAYLYV